MANRIFSIFITLAFVVCLLTTVSAQSTGFTYQGRLADSGTAVNGNYDLQFALWNSSSGGAQVGSTQTNNSVAVSNGVFTVNLDFGANAFPGAGRFLEIAVRPAGVGSFTTLAPRQPITSTPYAVRSLNAATADSVPASGVPSGSDNYIQNTTLQQTSTNFNISGSGTAGGTLSGNVVNATTHYTLGNQIVLTNAGNANLFAGGGAGISNTTGTGNAFFGFHAGGANTTGSENSFFGIGTGNACIFCNTTGSRNTLLGSSALVGAKDLTNATAIGACSFVGQSNSLVLGSLASNPQCTSPSDTNVGIGTNAPQRKLHIKGAGADGFGVGDLLVTSTGVTGSSLTLEATGSGGRRYSWLSTASDADSGPGVLAAFDSTGGAYRMVITNVGNVGIGTEFPTALLSVNGGANKPGGGSWGSFSDERLKNIKGRYTPGLHAVMQLQPLRYEYKPDNALKLKADGEYIGFSAQAVQKAVPEAVSQTDSGYLVVNNDPILWTMLNAIKEQQAQIQKQSELIEAQRQLARRQQKEIAALKRGVSNRRTRYH